MALSTSFLKNAQTELSRLRAEQAKLVMEIQHLEGLLRGPSLGEDNPASELDLSSDDQAIEERTSPELEGVGLTEALRRVLRTSQEGLRPADAARALEKFGFKMKSTATPLTTRVSNELARMARVGQIARENSGEYHMNQ